MSAAVLSICIPTHNRLDYVRAAIEALAPLRARLAIELVVSDDASSDGTPAYLAELAARDPAVRVFQQPRRLGGFANTAFVLRAARGRFALYHGDDDRLAHEAVIELVDWLDGHPGHAAVYGPVEIYDLALDRSGGPGRYSDQTMEFDHGRRAELVAYVAMSLTPEHAIYRTECLRRTLYDARIYWSLGFLDAALQAGTVRFGPTPFYRAIVSHWPGERRWQLGDEVMADLVTWETFRAGLEMIAARQPGIAARPQMLAETRARIDASIRERQGKALDFLIHQGRWIEFVNSYRILAARRALPRAFAIADLFRASLCAIAAVVVEQSVLSGRRRVVLIGLAGAGDLLAETLRDAGMAAVETRGAATDDDTASAVLIAADAAQAQALIRGGAAAHAVLDFAALFQAYDLSELA